MVKWKLTLKLIFSVTGNQVLVWLPARSLLVMSGEARYSWSHGITPRHYDTMPCSHLGLDQDGLTLVHRDIRVSLTFRWFDSHPIKVLGKFDKDYHFLFFLGIKKAETKVDLVSFIIFVLLLYLLVLNLFPERQSILILGKHSMEHIVTKINLTKRRLPVMKRQLRKRQVYWRSN